MSGRRTRLILLAIEGGPGHENARSAGNRCRATFREMLAIPAWSLFLITLGATVTPSLTSAQAQGAEATTKAPEALEEIVVTAQRREESLQKTSLAIQVVSSNELKQAGVTEVRDLQTLVPGLQIGQASSSAQLYIRGIGDLSSTPVTNPAVSFNADGVYIARSQAVEGNFFDVNRMEVLKGPQGTLYGRNSIGGAINVISNEPNLDSFGGYATVEGGNYGKASFEGALNLPVTSEFAIRLAAQTVSRDSYDAGGGDDDHHEAARLQALWKTGSVSVLAGANFAHMGGVGPGAVLDPVSAAGISSPWTSATDPRAQNYLYEAAAAQGLPCLPAFLYPTVHNPGTCPQPPNSPFPTTQIVHASTGAPSQDNSFWTAYAQIVADLGFATLTVLPAYQSASIDDHGFSGDFDYDQHQQAHTTTVEARLSNDTPNVKWVGGLYYYRDSQASQELVDAGLIQNNAPITDQSTDSKAVFGQATFSLADPLRLILGARYTEDEKDIFGTVTSLYPSLDFPPAGNPACAAPRCLLETYSGNRDFDKFTWKTGLEYDLAAQNMLFVTVSTGFKAGGFDQSATATSGSTHAQSFNPETLTAYELGSRNRFLDDRLQVNLEAFYWEYKNHQEPHVTLDGQGQIAFDFLNAGNARAAGLDLDTVYKLTRVDIFRVAVEYLDSKFQSFAYDVPNNPSGGPFERGPGNGFTSLNPLSAEAANTGCATSAIKSGPDTGGVHVDCSGFPLTHAPKWSGSANLEHVFDLARGANVALDFYARFASASWLGIDFIPAEHAPAYITEDVTANYSPSGVKWWSVGLYARNLTNRAVYTGGFENPFVAGIFTATIGPPRTVGGTFSVNF
jgi:iron complex outermembrane recepter protein